MISRELFLFPLFLFFLIQISLAQHHSSESWESGAGPSYSSSSGSSYPMKIRNSGPSKIFEWIGSRFSKLPSLLPRLPSFPKYESSHKLPNYQVIIPQPPNGHHQEEDGEEFYSGPSQGDYSGDEDEGQGHHHQGQGGPQSNVNYIDVPEIPQSKYPQQPVKHQQEPPKYPQNYQGQGNQFSNDVQGQGSKAKESPIEVFPSKMVMYEKETYPPIGAEHGWRDAVPKQQVFQNQGHNAPPQSLAQQNFAPQSYVPPQGIYQAPPQQNFVEHNYVQPSQDSYTAQQQQNFAPPQPAPPPKAKGQGPKGVVKHVPVTPHSTGPDYFNTAYYHQGSFQTQQGSSISAEAPSFGTFGAAYSSAQQQAASSPVNDVDLTQADISSLLSTIDQTGFVQTPNPYAHLNYPAAEPTNQIPSYQLPSNRAAGASKGDTQEQGSKYVSLSPGVKVLQSQESGNPAFEVIADANAPSYNGHPFDLNKLISMIEPGAQLVEAPQASLEAQDTSSEGSENRRVVTSPGSSTSGSSAATTGAKTSGSSDLIITESLPSTNPTPLKTDTDLSLPSLDLSHHDIDLTNKSSTNLKDLMTFFQQTDGKGYVVVERKGPREPVDTDLDLFDLETKNELETPGDETRLNITADSLKYLLRSNNSTHAQHPNHNYNKKSADEGDLEIAESNVRSIAITVTPPSATTLKQGRKLPSTTTTLQPITTPKTLIQPIKKSGTPLPAILNQSISSSVSQSKMRPGPVYKKKAKIVSKEIP